MPPHRFRADLPDFIWPEVIQCDLLYIPSSYSTKVQRICLVLSRELKLYAFQRKQLLASINLTQTVLGKVAARLQQLPTAPSFQKSTMSDSKSELEKTTSSEKSNLSTSSSTNTTTTPFTAFRKNEVSLGKYIYCGLIETQHPIYLLIQCWDKLLIVQYQQATNEMNEHRNDNKEEEKTKSDCHQFVITDEYENVKFYKLVHGTLPFCPLIEIKCENETIRTDLQQPTSLSRSASNELTAELNASTLNNKDDFNQLLERVEFDRQELDRSIIRTGQAFERLQNRLTFGMPNIRSLCLSEKQMLVRCGDVWRRLTPNGHLVIGVPLANQCIPPNLTIIRHLRPIIMPTDGQLLQQIHCEYRLYYLRQSFTSLESLQTFLATLEQEESNNLETQHWLTDDKESILELLPESFAVLIIKLSVKELISVRQKLLLMINYEVFREIAGKAELDSQRNADTVHPLQMFIQDMDLQQIWYDEEQRRQLVIDFRPETIHQDFLAIAMSSHESRMMIEFNSSSASDLFAQNLEKHFDLQRCPLRSKQETSYDDTEILMEGNNNRKLILYNSNRNSLWFGCLAIRLLQANATNYDTNEPPVDIWKFYHPSDDKRVLFIDLMKNELFCKDCNVKSLGEYSLESVGDENKQLQLMGKLEDCLRHELEMAKNILISMKDDQNQIGSKMWLKKLEQYAEQQFITDTIFSKTAA